MGSTLNIIDESGSTFKIAYLSQHSSSLFSPGESVPLEGSATKLVASTRSTLIVRELAEETRFWSTVHFLTDGLRSLIAVPLISKDRAIGSFSLSSRRSNAYGEREQGFLERLAPYIASAITNAQLYEESQERAKEVEVIGEVARIISSSLDIGQVYERFAEEVRRMVDFDYTSLDIIDEVRGTFKVTYLSHQGFYSEFREGDTVPLEGTGLETLLKTRSTVIYEELTEHDRSWTAEHLARVGVRSRISVPLISKDRVVGAFLLFSLRPNAYGVREKGILQRLASQIAPAVENSLLFQEVQRLALALESIGDGVNFLDPQGNIQFINRSFEEIFGYRSDEVLGKSITIVHLAGQDNQALNREILRKANEGRLEGRSQASEEEWSGIRPEFDGHSCHRLRRRRDRSRWGRSGHHRAQGGRGGAAQ